MKIIPFSSFAKGRPVVFTIHAREKAKQYNIDTDDLKELVINSIKEHHARLNQEKKRYSNEGKLVTYWRNGTYLFVVVEQQDKTRDIPICLVVTVIDQKYNL